MTLSDYDGRTPLHVAAALGLDPLCRLLLSGGADPQAKDNFGNTPLSEHKRVHRADFNQSSFVNATMEDTLKDQLAANLAESAHLDQTEQPHKVNPFSLVRDN